MYVVGWLDTYGMEVMMNFFQTKAAAVQYVIDEIRDNYPNFWDDNFEDARFYNGGYSYSSDDEYAARQPTPELKTEEIDKLRNLLNQNEKYYFEYNSGEWASITIAKVP